MFDENCYNLAREFIDIWRKKKLMQWIWKTKKNRKYDYFKIFFAAKKESSSTTWDILILSSKKAYSFTHRYFSFA